MTVWPDPDDGHRDNLVPVTAGRVLRDLMVGPLRTWERMGATDSLAWLRVGRDVIVVQSDPAASLPNSVVGPAATFGRMTALPESGVVGQGRLEVGRAFLEVVRWWDPVPRLPVVAPIVVAERVTELSRLVAPVDDAGLAVALTTAIPADIHRAGEAMLGMGEGLIPEGDDVLIGSLAALRLLGPAVRAPVAHRLLAELAAAVLADAWMATIDLAASLLHHAHAGAVSAPLGRLLTALAGRGTVAETAAALLATGPNSGNATLTGVLAGAGCLAGVPA